MLEKTRQGPRMFDGLVVPPGPTIKEWDAWPVEAKKFFLWASKCYTIGRIVDVNAFIHQVQFTGRYRIDEIRAKLGRVKPQPNDEKEFKFKYVRNVRGNNWSFFLVPVKLRPYNCLLRAHNPTPKDLKTIRDSLPELSVRTVEYAIDVMCANPDHVADLYGLLKRYLWFPRHEQKYFTQKGVASYSLYYDPFIVYERGQDKDRNYKRKYMHWRRWQLDRVRMEFSPSPDQLAYKGVESINDLLDDPRFSAMLSGPSGLIYQFAKFKDEAEDVRHEWEKYPSYPKPNADLGQCFQEQYLDLVDRHTEPHKKVEPAEGFDDLIDLIHVAVQNFGLRWHHDLEELGGMGPQ
jgi:hypothetical protein